jgi:hypothetical protein
MNAIRCLGVVVVAVAVAGCGSNDNDFTDVSEAAVVGQKHWSYEDVEEWGSTRRVPAA